MKWRVVWGMMGKTVLGGSGFIATGSDDVTRTVTLAFYLILLTLCQGPRSCSQAPELNSEALSCVFAVLGRGCQGSRARPTKLSKLRAQQAPFYCSQFDVSAEQSRDPACRDALCL